MEWMVTANEPGKTFLLQGNEAIVRGALEAGIRFAASYPGSPSSEILTILGRIASKMNLYAEWSTNESCAFGSCMGASLAGVRSLCIVKQNGLLTIGDALHSAALSGCRGGLVLIAADDPSAHSSTNEFDTRHQARAASIIMLEPATFQEAKEMVKYGFELSEQLRQVVMIRVVTRICHGRGNVVLGEFQPIRPPATVGKLDKLLTHSRLHQPMLDKLDKAQEIFETSLFNSYEGPESPEHLVITSGTGWAYSWEAIEKFQARDRVGLLKLGCTWPLPEQLIVKHISRSKKVLVIEEVDPVLEQNIANIIGHHPELTVELAGRYQKKALPSIGELNPDVVENALARQLGLTIEAKPHTEVPAEAVVNLPERGLTFCAGCPHRATFFIIKQVLEAQGKHGIVMGDIGCYSMGAGPAGHFLTQASGCMGEGINMAEGLGQLTRFGFNQPVIALAGDSTFFHSCLPGLVSARYHNANMLFVILDNSATAMTGFQPHPGIERTAMGEHAHAISIEKLVEAVGCSAIVADPFDIAGTTAIVYRLLKQKGLQVLILRQKCATLVGMPKDKPRVWVDEDMCRSDTCGCGKFCNRIWGCPGNTWNSDTNKAKIDDVVCNGCGVCVSLCPAGAIKIEGGKGQ